jgi:hypothetical protein
MHSESGRSLVEIIGILAIGGVMTAAVLVMYNTVRTRQTRVIATENLKQITQNVKLLMGARGDYTGVSVDFLIKSGALGNTNPPLGGEWSVNPEIDPKSFAIKLTNLSGGECDYFATVKLDWATKIRINGNETDPGTYCIRAGANQVEFIIE